MSTRYPHSVNISFDHVTSEQQVQHPACVAHVQLVASLCLVERQASANFLATTAAGTLEHDAGMQFHLP